MKTKDQTADLTSYSILVTTEATLIRLGCTLYHFKAKTKNYICYEDINTQFMHSQGQNGQHQRKQKTVRGKEHLAVRGILIISHVTVLRLS